MWMATKYGWFDVAAHHGKPEYVAIRSPQKEHLRAYQKRCYGEVRYRPAPVRAWSQGWWISIPKVDWMRHCELFAQDAANESNLQGSVAANRGFDVEYRLRLKDVSHAIMGSGGGTDRHRDGRARNDTVKGLSGEVVSSTIEPAP
jgi:hypothetical protein